MHTPRYCHAVLFGILLFTIGCTLTRGASVVIGVVRNPIDPETVKLYTSPPKKFEKIAHVSADSRNDFASQQNLTDNAILRLKKEAAKVGANGILFEGISNYQVGTTGVAGGNLAVPIVFGASNTRTGKETKGIAIYVIEE